MRSKIPTRLFTALATTAVLSGCGALGTLGTLAQIGELLGVLGGPAGQQSGQIAAEVQQVDTRQRAIHLRTQDGRTGAVRYDQRTQVVYRQQTYPVTAIERGDLVVAQVQQTGQNEVYASHIEVTQSVRERAGTGQLVHLAGTVRQVDHSGGTFLLETQTHGTVQVSLPYNPGAAAADRFRRLRIGEAVGIEAAYLSETRMELRRFL
jgi:hypothetical protein